MILKKILGLFAVTFIVSVSLLHAMEGSQETNHFNVNDIVSLITQGDLQGLDTILACDDVLVVRCAYKAIAAVASQLCQKIAQEKFKDYYNTLQECALKMALRFVYNIHYEESIDKHDCKAIFDQPRLTIRVLSRNVSNSTVSVVAHIDFTGHTLLASGNIKYLLPLLTPLMHYIVPFTTWQLSLGSMTIPSPYNEKLDQKLLTINGIHNVALNKCDVTPMGLGKIELSKESDIDEKCLQLLIDQYK